MKMMRATMVITMMRVLAMARIMRTKMRINVEMMMCTRTRPIMILGHGPRAAKRGPRAAKRGPRAAESGPRAAKRGPRAARSGQKQPMSSKE